MRLLCFAVLVPAALATTPTFYFRTGLDLSGCPPVQTFSDGQKYGPCFGGQIYGPQSKYWAAVRNGALHCGEAITMTYGANQISLTVMDDCPGCYADNHVDMSLEAMVELGGSKEAACAINRLPMDVQWSFNPQTTTAVAIPLTTPTTSASIFTQFSTGTAKNTHSQTSSTIWSTATTLSLDPLPKGAGSNQGSLFGSNHIVASSHIWPTNRIHSALYLIAIATY